MKRLFVFLIVLLLISLGSMIVLFQDESEEQGLLVANITIPKDTRSKIEIKITPSIDYTYSINEKTVSIKPLSKMVDGVEYKLDIAHEGDTAASILFFEDSSLASKILDDTPILGDQFTLHSVDRHHFYVSVFAGEPPEEDALFFGRRILKSYGIDPNSVALDIEYTYGARGDGVTDPFREPEKRQNEDFETPFAPGSANQ